MARPPRVSRGRTTRASGPLRDLLKDLRQIWSTGGHGTSQPALRDYPLRRSTGGVR
jgi:hypothetical protein